MRLSFKKTEPEQTKLTRIVLWIAVIALLINIWYLFSINGQVPDATSINYENIVQSHVMMFKLKMAVGLFALGTIASYGLTWIITHTPLGRWMFTWSNSKDDSSSRAAKTLSLGLVFASSIIGVFTLLSSVIGR